MICFQELCLQLWKQRKGNWEAEGVSFGLVLGALFNCFKLCHLKWCCDSNWFSHFNPGFAPFLSLSLSKHHFTLFLFLFCFLSSFIFYFYRNSNIKLKDPSITVFIIIFINIYFLKKKKISYRQQVMQHRIIAGPIWVPLPNATTSCQCDLLLTLLLRKG